MTGKKRRRANFAVFSKRMVKKICLLTRCLLIRRLDVVLGQLRMGYMVYPKAILISSEPDKQETGSGEGFNMLVKRPKGAWLFCVSS